MISGLNQLLPLEDIIETINYVDPNETRDKNDLIETLHIFIREILEKNPQNFWVMGFLALVKGEIGETDAAIQLCQKALKIEPKATAIHFLLAQAFFKKGDYFGFVGESLITLRLKSEEDAANKELENLKKQKEEPL